MGVPVERIPKISEGSPNVVDRIEAGDVDIVINTPTGSGARADGYEIRRAAVAARHPLHHDHDRRAAAQRAIRALRRGDAPSRSLQELHSGKTPRPTPARRRERAAHARAVRPPDGAR